MLLMLEDQHKQHLSFLTEVNIDGMAIWSAAYKNIVKFIDYNSSL